MLDSIEKQQASNDLSEDYFPGGLESDNLIPYMLLVLLESDTTSGLIIFQEDRFWYSSMVYFIKNIISILHWKGSWWTCTTYISEESTTNAGDRKRGFEEKWIWFFVWTIEIVSIDSWSKAIQMFFSMEMLTLRIG